MINGRKLIVVMPAYNAAKTLERTLAEVPMDIVDKVILVDDCSKDNTSDLGRKLGLEVIRHEKNRGYGGNQKTCYSNALKHGADIVVMLHPDYQYTPKLIRAMASLIAEDVYDVVLGSRILGTGARQGGMPLYKYIANRALTFAENIMIGHKLSEYHTGYRAFSKKVLSSLNLELNSDDFVFDNQMLVQCHAGGFRIAEITCPTKYFDDASSINFQRSVKYGFGCLSTGLRYLLHRLKIKQDPAFILLSGAT